MNVMGWLMPSPDQNPFKNIYTILSRDIYKNGRQFNTVKDLEEALTLTWDAINIYVFQNLVLLTPRRIVSLIEANGGPTLY